MQLSNALCLCATVACCSVYRAWCGGRVVFVGHAVVCCCVLMCIRII